MKFRSPSARAVLNVGGITSLALALALVCLTRPGGTTRQPCERPVERIVSIPASPSSVCTKTALRYEPSDVERAWVAAISQLKSDAFTWPKGCERVRTDLAQLQKELLGIRQHQTDSRVDLTSFHLSNHQFRDDCTGEISKVYLEPLVSFLRHPLALCAGLSAKVDIFDKSYMLLPHLEEVTSVEAYKWLFDAGASTYDTGAGGASQSWFVEEYRKRGIEFDRIIGWEAAQTNPKTQWDVVPADIKRKTSWYNIPASSDVGHADNPLTFIKTMTKPEDYVVFKLDIDTPDVEVALVEQILNDTEIQALIDEFYFEHHVMGSPMQWHGWGDLRESTSKWNSIEDSYTIFSRLREKGIRAHSWV